MRRLIAAFVWLSVAVAVVSFFLPWAKIDVREPGLSRQMRQTVQAQGLLKGLTEKLGRVTVQVRRGAKTISGELPTLSDIPHHVSGRQIPQLANQKNAQVVTALFEMVTNTRQDIGLNSYAVYLVPGLAVVFGLLLTFAGMRPVALVVAAASAAVAAAGFWKLLTTNTQALFVAITIGPGLWLSLWAYVALSLSALLRFVDTSSPRSL